MPPKEKPKSTKTSVAQKAGLLLPPSAAMKVLRKTKMRVGMQSAVAAAAAVEYIVAEMIELAHTAERSSRPAGERAKNEKVRISLKALSSAVRSDKELNNLFSHVALSTGRALRRSHPGELGMLTK